MMTQAQNINADKRRAFIDAMSKPPPLA